MLARIRKALEKNDQGFTLIELLVVMMIIGVLAAIAIPSFVNQKAKARVSALKSDANSMQAAFATYYVDGTTAPTLAGTAPTYTIGASPNQQTVKMSGNDSVVNTPAAAPNANADGTFCLVLGTGTSSDGYVSVTSTAVTFSATAPTTCTAA